MRGKMAYAGFMIVSLVMGWASVASALERVYAMPGYVYGVFDDTSRGNMSYITPTPALAFEGATLEELEDCEFGGWMCGAWIAGKGNVRSYETKAYRDGSGELQFLLVTPKVNDSNLIKGVVIKLTQGEGGVYAQGLYAGYTSGSLTDVDFVNLGADGEITFNYTQGTVATSYDAGGYGVCALNAMRWVQKTPTLAFQNPPGQPVLRVADLVDYRFSGVIAGGSIYPVKYTRVEDQNKFVTYENDEPVKIRLEMQLLDDRYLKCPIVELTNGEGGVYAQIIAARYVTVTEGITLGYAFVGGDGEYLGNGGSISTGPTSGGYGVAGLEAHATDDAAYTLETSKRWSEMTGSAAAVDNASLDVVINVTGQNPTLTFDTPVNVHSLIIQAVGGNDITFALADGTVAPTATFWNLGAVSGTVTFDDFTPVMDAATANIQPNSAATLVFNADLKGLLPYNNAVAVPCAEMVFGGTQTFTDVTFAKAGTVPVTLTGTTTFNGTTSLASGQVLSLAPCATLQLNGTLRANGSGAVVQFADGTILQPLGATTTIAAGVTMALPENGSVSLRIPADVADATLGGSGAQFTSGSLVLDAGTLHARSGEEGFLTVAAGGTLAITVSDALVHSGYVSSATVAEGGVIRFYTEDGTEVGIGRPEMPVLPPTDAAIWAPVEGNDRSFDSGIHWSSGSTPPDGADVSVTAGETGSATIEIWRVQNFGQITVAQDAEITFTLGQHDSGMVVTADTLALADGASVTLPIAAFRPGTVTLGRDAVLRLVGASGIGETFSSVITSDANGRVEVVSGTVTFDQYSTYSGGTLIKCGAVVKVGAIRQVIDNTYCGVLGKMVNANVITIEEGAALDIAGNPDQNYVLNVTGQGIDLGDGTFSGAVFNSGVSRGVNNSQLYGITLADDVMLRADNDFGLVARGHSGWLSIALGEHTLTKTGTNTLLFATNDGMTLSGTGTLSVEEGTLSQLLGVINAGSASLNIGEAGRFSATRDTTFGRIDNAGTFAITASPADATVTVKGDYYGDGRVDKFGQGTSSMNVWNASHGTIYVHEGRHAILGHTPNYGMFHVFNTEEEPNANLKAVVDEGAQFDMNGVPDVTMNVVIAGERADDDPALRGALVNRGGDIGTGKCQVIQLTLATNACVSGVSDYGLIGPGYNTTLLELGEWTMRLYTLKNFWLVNADITGTGTLAVDAGALTFLNKPSRGNDWTLEIGPNAQLVANQTFSVSNLVFRGQSGGGAIVTVFGTYTPDSQTLPNVQLTGPAAGIDVSGMSEPWDTEAYGPLSYSPGTEVTVRLGDRAVAGNEKLLAWREIPAYVTAWRHDLTGSDLKVVARGDGLYLTRSGTVLILN